MAKYGGTPPFFTQNFFFQNDSEWLEMDLKHNFIKCKTITHFTHRQLQMRCYWVLKKDFLSQTLQVNFLENKNMRISLKGFLEIFPINHDVCRDYFLIVTMV